MNDEVAILFAMQDDVNYVLEKLTESGGLAS